MDAKELNKLLEQIHAEISTSQSIDERGYELLKDLNEHIDALIEQAEKGTIVAPRSTIQQLEDSIGYFEVTHPTLTLVLSNFLNTLSSSGI